MDWRVLTVGDEYDIFGDKRKNYIKFLCNVFECKFRFG